MAARRFKDADWASVVCSYGQVDPTGRALDSVAQVAPVAETG
jgi:hypothetical protein